MQAGHRREEVRAALIDAAERAITARGLGGLKAREIAQEVGCALGTIYTLFADLDELILEVNRRTLILFDAWIAGVPAPPDEADPVAELVRLARAYLAFARANPLRWRALFQHRLGEERTPPDWYVAEQGRLFHQIERPLRRLRPDLPDAERQLLARSLFSATHGLVSLGLDEKLTALDPVALDAQVETVVGAVARGLLTEQPQPGDGPA